MVSWRDSDFHNVINHLRREKFSQEVAVPRVCSFSNQRLDKVGASSSKMRGAIRNKTIKGRDPRVRPDLSVRVGGYRITSPFKNKILSRHDPFSDPGGVRGGIDSVKKVLQAKVFRRESVSPEALIFRSKFPTKFRNEGFIKILHSFKTNTTKSFRLTNVVPTNRNERISVTVRTPPKFPKNSIHFSANRFRKRKDGHLVSGDSSSNERN